MSTVVDRPVWRRFLPKFTARAAAYARSGGHAAIVHGSERVQLLLPATRRGEITELGEWSLLAIEQTRWRRVGTGPARGLMSARVDPDYVDAVIDWCARDSVHAGPTRRISLDCLACAACCHDANVVLGDEDLARWRNTDRDELTTRANVIRSKSGVIHLRFADNGRCRHLGRDNRCAIYAIRPDNCRVFVIGSEACLAAREETLGLRDGAS